MAATFVLGRAGAGKTHYCVDALLACLREPDDRRLILIVPEQASFQMERLLVTRVPGHGFCRAEVLSFSRLATRVLAETGAEPESLDRARRQLALRAVAFNNPEAISAFGRAARTDGFFARLDRLIESLLRDGVTPEALLAAGARTCETQLASRTASIAALYEGYLAWLGPDRLDPAQRLARLRESLDQLAWIRGARVWVDGFAGFTGEELVTLAAIARRCESIHITLLLDSDVQRGGRAATIRTFAEHGEPEFDLFHRIRKTGRQLQLLLEGEGVTVKPPLRLSPDHLPRFVSNSALARLERGLASPQMRAESHHESTAPTLWDAAAPTSQVRVMACATHREEIEQAARWVRRKMAESGGKTRYRDFAVIARDLEPFAETITDVFEQYEIPFFLDRRRPMRSHALARMIPAVFEAAAGDLSPESSARLLRSGLIRAGANDCERIENAVRRYELRGLSTWRRPDWNVLPELSRHGEPPRWRAVRRLVAESIAPLRELARGGPVPATHWVETLFTTLRRLGVRGRMERWIGAARREKRWEAAELHRLAWDHLCSVLDSIHAVLAREPVEFAVFRTLVERSLREMTLGLAPPTMDQVLCSSIERSRHPDIRFAWVMAFNEGVFPARPGEDALLSTEDRERLRTAGFEGLPSAREDVLGERLLAYIALTRPSRELTISYAHRGMEGEELPPSPLLEDVLSCGAAIECAAESDSPPVSLPEFVRAYQAYAKRVDAGPASARLRALRARLESRRELRARLDPLLARDAIRRKTETVGNYRLSLSTHSQEPGEPTVVWHCSATEIDSRLACPFQHFAKYGLRLDVETRPQPLPRLLGVQAHEVLAIATRTAGAHQGFPELDEKTWRLIIRQAIAEFARGNLRGPLTGSRSQRFLLRSAWRMLEEVFLAHGDRWARGGFRPLHCEQSFGGLGRASERYGEPPARPTIEPTVGAAVEIGGWPALRISADAGEVLVRGKIDRVDIAEGEDGRTRLAIYDYKRGYVCPITESLLVGRPLQLLLYLLAADRAGKGLPHDPAGALLAPLSPPRSPDPRLMQHPDASFRRMMLFRPRGLIAEEAARTFDRNLGSTASPIVAMRLKNGSAEFDRNQSGDVHDTEELVRRTSLAELTVCDAAVGVAAGDVSVAPLLHRNTLACRQCEFRPVCRFELGVHAVRNAAKVLRGPDSSLPDGAPAPPRDATPTGLRILAPPGEYRGVHGGPQ